MEAIASCFGLILDYFYGFSHHDETLLMNGRYLKITRHLAEGGFGFVMLVKENNDYGEPNALKRIRIQLPEHMVRAKNEIEAHKTVNSPNVLKLLESDFITRNGSVTDALLLLPFCKNGTIQDWIDRLLPDEFIPFNHVLKLSMGIIKGLEAFHSTSPPLAFRDLKPANVLIGDNNDAILMDLGSVANARLTLESRKDALALYDFCAETVTAPFRPPELYDPPSFGRVDESSDIWSLGCTMYAMAFKQSPFDGTLTAVVSGTLDFPKSNHPYPARFLEILSLIIQVNPQNRPLLSQIKEWIQLMIMDTF